MSLIINDSRAESLAHELARREGVTPGEAVARALEAKLASGPRETAAVRLRALREEMRAAQPGGLTLIPWETVKRWARDEPDDQSTD